MNAPPDPDALLEHDGFVRSLARAILHDENRVDDAVQQTWIAVLQSRDSRPRTLRIWLATLVRNIARDFRRRDDARARNEQAASRPEATPAMTTILEREAARREVVDAVARLEEPYQTVILLKYFEGLSPGEIARKLNIPVETARTRQKRAIELIRAEIIKKRGGTESAALALLPIAGWHLYSGPLSAPSTSIGVFTLVTTKTKSLLGAAAALLLLLAGWIFFINNSEALPKPPNTINTPEIAAAAESLPDSAPSASAASQPAREKVNLPITTPASNSAGFGSLLVHVRYFDQTPAAGIGVGWYTNADTAQAHHDRNHYITNSEGYIEFQRVPVGTVALFFDCSRPRYEKVTAGEARDVTITLFKGFDVEGKVIDKSGAPFPNATIYFWSTQNFNGSWPVTKADGEGKFTIRQVDDIDDYYIFAAVPGYSPSIATRMLEIQPGTKIQLTLKIADPGAELAGRVHDTDGNPVVGATVSCGRINYTKPAIAVDGTNGMYAVAPDTKTDEKGNFIIQSISVGEQQLYIRKTGFALHKDKLGVAASGNAPLDITLQKEVVLTGCVRDAAGNPVDHGQIEIGRFTDPDFFYDITKKDGTFRITGLPVGTIEVVAFFPNKGRSIAKLTGVAGEEIRWDPVIDAGLTLIGKVTDEKGNPLRNCTVRAQPNEYKPSDSFRGGEMKTDDAGQFKISGCPNKLMRVSVAAPPYGQITIKTIENVSAAAGELVIVIEGGIDVTSKIRARLVDSAMKPVQVAAVTAYRRGAGGGSTAMEISPDGIVEIINLIEGDYYLDISALNIGKHTTNLKHVGKNETCDFGTIQIEKPGTLVIHPRLKGAARVNRLGMLAMNFERETGNSISMQDSGDFGASLAPGKYHLIYSDWVPKNTTAARVLNVDIRSGEETSVDLDIVPGALHAFQFTAPKELIESIAPRTPSRLTVTDAAGTIFYDNIASWWPEKLQFVHRAAFAPGKYHYEVTVPPGFKASGDFTVDSAVAPETKIETELKR